MTKEEALKVLVKMREWRRWGHGEQNEEDMPEMPEQKEVDEALDVYIEVLSQPYLPSNMDEAELKYVEFSDYPPANQEEELMVYNAFKAGAEWNAVQGITKEAVIGMATEEIFIKVSEQTLDGLDLRPGDKVVVQIRKK